MSEVGFFEKGKRVLFLKLERVKKAHQGFMGLGSFGRAVLEASIPEDHMRADHPLSQVIVERNLGMFKKSQEVEPVGEEAFGEAPQALISVFPAGPEKEALFQEPDSPLVDGYPKRLPIFFKTQGISKNPSQDFVIFHKRLGGVFESKLAHLPQEMDKAFLFFPREPIISRVEVRDEDAPVVFGKNFLGDLGSPGLGNLVIGEPFIDNRPEPMAGPAHLPAGFVHMEMGTLTDGFNDLLDLDPEPLAHPLEGLGQGPFRDLEMSEALEELLNLIERKAVVIFQDHSLNQDVGTQVTVRDLFRGVRGCDHLLTRPAPVAVLLKKSDLGMGGDEVFLGVLDHFLGPAQTAVAIRAAFEGLGHHPVDSLGLRARQTHVPDLLAGNLGAPHALSQPQGLQEFLLGLFLFLLPELSFKLLDTLLFLQDDFDEFFFGSLGEEELAVFSHTLKNGQ